MIEGNFLSHDNLNLKSRSWITDQPKGKILFVHGLFEYAGRYTYEADFFNSQGFDFLGYDQRTHGASDGKPRSYIDSFDKYIKDCGKFLDRHLKGDLPFFLYAHSMGGLVLISYLLTKKFEHKNFRGVLLTGPFLQVKEDMSPILQKLSGLIGRLVPKMRVSGSRPNSISRDPEEVKKYIDDPLVYTDGIYAATGYNMIKQSKSISSKIDKFDYPYLLMHGTNDLLSEIKGSENMHEKSKSKDKTFIKYPNYMHEITRDVGRDQVLSDMMDWMKCRM